MTQLSRRQILKAGAFGAAALSVPAAASAFLSGSEHDRLFRLAEQELSRLGNKIVRHDRVGIADFSPYSANPRFFLLDREAGTVQQFLVSHGRGSDPYHLGFLQNFSNVPGSNATSRGAYVTEEYYFGQHDLSMRLTGLDYDNYTARDRAIVVHGAWYAEQAMIEKYGKLGRSEGCFAFSQEQLPQILDRLGPGRLLFADKVSQPPAPASPAYGDSTQALWPSSTFDGTAFENQ